MNTAARNERRKITATAANNLSIALVVTGIIVPTVTLAYQLSAPKSGFWYAFALLWGVGSLLMHLIARNILKGIEE